MSTRPLPPCGLYRTAAPVGDVPQGRLVYFHNHGNPGPGVYLPERWVLNRAEFQTRGVTLPEPYELSAALLEPLPAEGFYRVTRSFFCCEKKCREFEPDLLVQLGYNGNGQAILFVPELGAKGVTVPQSGSLVSVKDLERLAPLKLAHSHDAEPARGGQLH